MADVDESDLGYRDEKTFADNGIADEEADDMVEAWKERIEFMMAESKPHFGNIFWGFQTLVN